MGLLIDASVLLEHQRRRLDLSPRLAAHLGETFFLSVVSVSELLRGAQRAGKARARSQRAAFVEDALLRFPLLPVDLASARAHARLQMEMGERAGRLSPTDLWLAAQAVAHGLVMVTGEPRGFERVPGLRVESWLLREN